MPACRLGAFGRVAQWESTVFTRQGSLVRYQPRPPLKVQVDSGFWSAEGRTSVRPLRVARQMRDSSFFQGCRTRGLKTFSDALAYVREQVTVAIKGHLDG